MRFVMGAIAVSVLTAACNPAAPGEVTTFNAESGNTLDKRMTDPALVLPGHPSVGTVMKAATATTTQSGSAAARLTLSKTSVMEVTREDSAGRLHHQYFPFFVVTEASGRSGASFSTMQVAVPSGEQSDNCFEVRVNAGATLDPFGVEESCYTSIYIGSPNVRTDSPLSSLTVALTFVDDQGIAGTLTVRFSMN